VTAAVRPGPLTAGIAALVATLSLTGCGGGAAAGGGQAARSDYPVVQGYQLQAPVDEVERAYLAYWGAWLAASRTPGAAGTQLQGHAAEPALGIDLSTLASDVHQGVVLRGSVDHHVLGMAVVGETRKIADCVGLDQWRLYDARTGLQSPGQLTAKRRQLAFITLRKLDGVWKVTDSQQAMAC
jgi:hypothetical protein